MNNPLLAILNFCLVLLLGVSCAQSNATKTKTYHQSNADSAYHEQLKEDTIDEISRIIRREIHRFRRCYYKEVQKRKGKHLSGKVTLVFQIRRDGKLQRAGVGESDLPLSLKSCIITELWKLRFPRPYTGGPIKVNQPLSF